MAATNSFMNELMMAANTDKNKKKKGTYLAAISSFI